MDRFARRSLRGTALQRLALLSVSTPHSSQLHEDPLHLPTLNAHSQSDTTLDRLASECSRKTPSTTPDASDDDSYINGFAPAPGTANIPMSIRELQVLLALCAAAPAVTNADNARKLVRQLSPYLLESWGQKFAPSPFLRDVVPSPWEALTHSLVTALLALGVNFPEFRLDVEDATALYTEKVLEFVERTVRDEGRDMEAVGALVMSFSGFLEAAAKWARFWSPEDRLRLMRRVGLILTQEFCGMVESTVQQLEGAPQWKRYLRRYEVAGKPVGAMLLQCGMMRLLVAATSLIVTTVERRATEDILDILLDGRVVTSISPEDFASVGTYADQAASILQAIEDRAPYVNTSDEKRTQLVLAVKAGALAAYCNCVVLSNSADPNVLYRWLQDTIGDPKQMSFIYLAKAVLKILAILAKDPNNPANGFISILQRFIVEGTPSTEVVDIAAMCLSHILNKAPQDDTITSLNTLGHVLSSTNPEKALKQEALLPFAHQPMASSLSLVDSAEGFRYNVYCNVIQTITSIAQRTREPTMVSLAISVLMQRVNKVPVSVRSSVLKALGALIPVASEADFIPISELIDKTGRDALWHDDHPLIAAVLETRCTMAEQLGRGSRHYANYLTQILTTVAAVGDENETDPDKKQVDSVFATKEIEQFIKPLSILLAHNGTDVNFALRFGHTQALRDFWINCTLHGIYYGSEAGKKHTDSLKVIAKYTPPVIAGVTEEKAFDVTLPDTSLMKRGNTPMATVEHKKRLLSMLPSEEVAIRPLEHARVLYLETAFTLESFRAESGECAKVLAYFVEPAFKTGEGATVMSAIAVKVTDVYIQRISSGTYPTFSAAHISEQLADIFVGCCHRLQKVQAVATGMANRIIAQVPSALCKRPALFALLELLTLVWGSCLQEEVDEYATKSLFSSAKGKIVIEMPDDFAFRRRTLNTFHNLAKGWMGKAVNIAPLDLKGLLQTYLSEFEDESTLGHISLGRSFALEIGAMVPATDQRLASIEHMKDCNANVASDFMKQFTVRQTYRSTETAENIRKSLTFAKANPEDGELHTSKSTISIQALIGQMTGHDYTADVVPVEDLKDMLRKAARLVCASEKNNATFIRHLVGIPFEVFTRKSIKLGMLLWNGIINERPELQSRVLAEIARQFEMTVEKQMGLFAESFNIFDAFEARMENAPSKREEHEREQRTATELLSPHLRLLQLLGSHFQASRFGNPDVQRIFFRLVMVALRGLKKASGHPLAREVRFQLVLLGLQVLRYSTGLKDEQKLKLKDLIVSGALSWFKFAPRWSFGSNRLQVKAEAHLLQDVATYLQAVGHIGANATALRVKVELLLLLIDNEGYRLATWLYPLEHSRRHHIAPSYSQRPPTDGVLATVLPAAWQEDPAIAVQLTHRFQSEKLKADVRRLVCNYPEKVVHLPDALELMLGDALSPSLTFQLRYLLYWKPVNPVTATTYFLPAYKHDAMILQYAMRALESHSVDVTFFYVPQIVQTLRYDVLGYVARFILETAKLSQLFAHQIIWNIKANAYKDEDATIPDPVKPTLDVVMTKLIDSFSPEDRSFYEREFAFFNEVTSISGKLRPYIRKTKPEKNQKIAEELAKITVDPGVYLPSNPDSVVIDIDRDSGKSLQSHAKAPFMATFKIKRKTADPEAEEAAPLDRQGHRKESTSTVTKVMNQAAIFKVGDDCRQDMLALQLIACFRSIFNSIGLDVYLFPYRVTATAPGCGVIDVLPNSISRDMLGRDYDMGLYDYFISKYGGEDSLAFQEARMAFVKSMAAYSVISYLLKFKDRHNGNIMLDAAGHILHIDFGFCFDIAPGGITFERAPFKLTQEMISVMGGSTESQSYLYFEELCIKAFLVSRQYVKKLENCVTLMLDSGLPCFKPETIQNFRERFVLEKTEREAADYMRFLVKKSAGSYSTGQYDRFQHLTNGIPY